MGKLNDAIDANGWLHSGDKGLMTISGMVSTACCTMMTGRGPSQIFSISHRSRRIRKPLRRRPRWFDGCHQEWGGQVGLKESESQRASAATTNTRRHRT